MVKVDFGNPPLGLIGEVMDGYYPNETFGDLDHMWGAATWGLLPNWDAQSLFTSLKAIDAEFQTALINTQTFGRGTARDILALYHAIAQMPAWINISWRQHLGGAAYPWAMRRTGGAVRFEDWYRSLGVI